MDTQQNQENYLKAQKRVGKIKIFYEYIFSYICFNILLTIINLLTSPQYLWFFWPLLSWGIVVVFHAIYLFNWLPFLSKDWEERKLKAFIEEEKKQNKK
jgi:hypothetical protein